MAKLTELKTDESGFIETDSCYFYLFNPGKLVFVPDSSQPGQTREAGFDERQSPSASSRRKSKSKEPLDQPVAILTTNSKMGNNFLHAVQAIDLLGETLRDGLLRVWEWGPIDALVRTALSRSPLEPYSCLRRS